MYNMERNKRLKTKLNKPITRPIRSPSPKTFPDLDSENSPLQIACTQESNDNIDVVWDWNSPQGKKLFKKVPRRLTQSPKVPLKKYPSITATQDIEKLKAELQALKNELALPDHEESLHLSPVEEAHYKTFTDTPLDNQDFQDEFDELMNDDINEKLFACSQQVEENLTSNKNNKIVESSVSSTKFTFKKTSPREKALANDSFDDLLGSMDVKRLTGSPDREEKYIYSNKQTIQTNSGKVEFCRTESFEIANNISSEVALKRCTQEEIERKRKEALAKLATKKKLESTFVSSQCSLQEIEAKRLQALAKVEAKRQQDIIERKRQEALKILELKRQKKAVTVKSALVTRLN